ncbi:MAG: Jag N-terminal domain-containing protein [Elusimicrobia bacterium]|nr:Jag N-terminal domain-containing protein [Elusimicrobiota bacterium]
MEGMESEGKSVSEAVEAALKKLGVRRDQVEVQILQEASSGFMGIGAKPARVKITQKHWGEPTPAGAPPKPAAPKPERRSQNQPLRRGQPERRGQQSRPNVPHARPAAAPAPKEAPVRHDPRPEPRREPRPEAAPVDSKAACGQSAALLKELLGAMGFESSKIAVSWDDKQERVKAVLDTPDAQLLIGSDGRGLESFQFIATLMLSRRLGTPAAVQVEALGYWEKREADILGQAQRGIDEVKRTGKACRLAPMDPAMRRLVHRNLAGHPDVETASEGEGSWRKIVLRPRRK